VIEDAFVAVEEFQINAPRFVVGPTVKFFHCVLLS